MQRDDASEEAATSWPRVTLLCLVGVTAALQIGKVPGQLHAMERELGLSLFQAGLIMSIFSLIAAIAGIGVGALADRYGNLRMIVAGLALGSLASIAGSFAQGATLLLASRIVEGFGFILATSATPSLIVAETSPADRGKALGLWSMYMPAGMSAMMVIAGLLVGWLDWRGIWGLTAAIGLGYAAVVWLVFRAPASAAAPRTRSAGLSSLVATALRPGPLLLAGCFLVYAGNFLALTGFLPLMLEHGGAASGGTAGLLAAVVVAVNMAGNAVSGFVAERGMARATIIAIAAAVMGLAAIGVFVEALPFAARYGLALVFSAVGGVIPGTCFGAAQSLAETPSKVGPLVGALIQGAGIGQLLGPPLVAVIVEAAGGWSGAAIFIALGALVNVGLALALLRVAPPAPSPLPA